MQHLFCVKRGHKKGKDIQSSYINSMRYHKKEQKKGMLPTHIIRFPYYSRKLLPQPILQTSNITLLHSHQLEPFLCNAG